MSTNDNTAFGTLRSFLWPIHRHEMRKFIPMLIMMFFACFNYSILRNVKDSLVVTTLGAMVIPFIKVWVILPAAILLTLLFTHLSNRFSQERVFYIILTIFLTFFVLFSFVLYPLRDHIHPTEMSGYVEGLLPSGLSGMVSMCCHWSFTLFYVMCELWSSLVLSVLFWGFANEVTRIHEARRFYSVLSIFSNMAAIIAGQVANYLALSRSWGQSLMILTVIVTLAGISMMVAFRWMNKNVLNDASFDELHKATGVIKPKKKKLSMRDSFSYLSNSKYLMLIAVIVIGYNLTINLAEVLWKDCLRELHPKAEDYNEFLNNLTSAVGVVSLITSIFMMRIISRFGWTWTAMITPVIMLITCAGFFSFMVFQDSLGAIALSLTGFSPLILSVYFGAAQNCFSKAMKYSVFDATKEMTFIPLDHEVKLKGKAAIDGVGSRLGKSGGSLIHTSLILVFGTLANSASSVAIIIIIAIAGWIVAVRSLGRQFAAIVKDQDQILADGEVTHPSVSPTPQTSNA